MDTPDISEATHELANAAKDMARSARNMAARITKKADSGLDTSNYAKPIIWSALSLSAAALIGLIAYRQKAGQKAGQIWQAMEDVAEKAIPARVKRQARAVFAESGSRNGRKRPRRTRKRGRPRQHTAPPSQVIH